MPDLPKKKGGMGLSDFNTKVREAMNSKGNYYPGKKNCVHFAFYLLTLVDFYIKLVCTELGITAVAVVVS